MYSGSLFVIKLYCCSWGGEHSKTGTHQNVTRARKGVQNLGRTKMLHCSDGHAQTWGARECYTGSLLDVYTVQPYWLVPFEEAWNEPNKEIPESGWAQIKGLGPEFPAPEFVTKHRRFSSPSCSPIKPFKWHFKSC